MTCNRCGKPLTGRQTKYCSKNCGLIIQVTAWRRRVKEKAVALKGGKCERCGWNEHVTGLDFHHPDPKQKEFGVGSGETRSWEKVKAEVEKCFLLCKNCHSVVHATSDPEYLIQSPVA